MAQLSDDCFAFGGALLRLDDALDDLRRRLVPLSGEERVSVHAALNRVLAENVTAGFAVPAFDNSAVDGYAVAHADLAVEGVTALPIGQRIPAGTLALAPHQRGKADRIFTGAMMPAGADTVFMQEDVELQGATVRLPAGLKTGSNRRLAGEDFAQGQVLVPAGTRLRPAHLAGIAAGGFATILVRRPLRVAIASTGNEIREPAFGEMPPLGVQYDANRPMLAGLLAARGMAVTDLGILPDDPERIGLVLREAARRHDAVLTSGGVSTGEEDHVKSALEAAGRLDFWRLAIKPGRPVAMGRIGDAVFLGMPGNPAAVFVTFTRFVGPVLDLLAGAEANRPVPFLVPSGFAYRKKRDRREYVRVMLRASSGGGWEAQRFPKDGAALVSSLIAADALAELDEDTTHIEKGQPLAVFPFQMLLG
jgi:molybdopterin molybdotransferase